MNQNWLFELERLAVTYAVPLGIKILGAIALWIVGRLVIRTVRNLIRRNLERRRVDVTLARYVDSALAVLFNILLILAVLSVFGVETASFAGLIAAGGVAIGMAWAGLLSNFAAGIFMVILRPFKVGDAVSAGGIDGTVREIGLFATIIDTSDNICSFVPNSKIFGGTIQNFSVNPHRTVNLKVPLAFGVDPADASRRLRDRIATLPHVLKEPAPAVKVAEVNGNGTVLTVSAATHNDYYTAVTAEMLRAVVEEFANANYPPAEARHIVRNAA